MDGCDADEFRSRGPLHHAGGLIRSGHLDPAARWQSGMLYVGLLMEGADSSLAYAVGSVRGHTHWPHLNTTHPCPRGTSSSALGRVAQSGAGFTYLLT